METLESLLNADLSELSSLVDSLARGDVDPIAMLRRAVDEPGLTDRLPELLDALEVGGASTDLLLELAGSRRPALQVEAARVLVRRCDPAARALFERRSRSRRAELRALAEEGLARLDAEAESPTSTPPIAPPPSVDIPESVASAAPTESERWSSAIEALELGQAGIASLLKLLQSRVHEGEPRSPEDPVSALEVSAVDALATHAAEHEDDLLTIADELHILRRGRFGCSVGAEFAAKRALGTLTGTQQISAYAAWREQRAAEPLPEHLRDPLATVPWSPGRAQEVPAASRHTLAPTPVASRGSDAPSPATAAPTPVATAPTRVAAAPTPAAESPPATETREAEQSSHRPEPGTVRLPPSDYWDRPPLRKKPWWKFW